MALNNSSSMNFRGMEVECKLPTVVPGETSTASQGTSKATTVVLNATAGQITTDDASLAAAAEVTFTVTNSYVTAKTVPVIAIASGAAATPVAWVSAVAAGSFDITISNLHAATAEDGNIVINFALIDVV